MSSIFTPEGLGPVMTFSRLDQAREDARYRLHNMIPDVLEKPQPKDAGERLFAISWEHRQLAICRLLQDNDQELYWLGLRRSGLAWLELMKRVKAGLAVKSRVIMSSRWFASSCALAAADFPLAQRLANHFPESHDPDREYIEDVQLYRFMAIFARKPTDTDTLTAACADWEKHADESNQPGLDACKAILGKDRRKVESALKGFAAERKRQKRLYQEQLGHLKTLVATEFGISIELVALVQMARLRGHAVSGEYPQCPAIACAKPPSAAIPDSSWTVYD